MPLHPIPDGESRHRPEWSRTDLGEPKQVAASTFVRDRKRNRCNVNHEFIEADFEADRRHRHDAHSPREMPPRIGGCGGRV